MPTSVEVDVLIRQTLFHQTTTPDNTLQGLWPSRRSAAPIIPSFPGCGDGSLSRSSSEYQDLAPSEEVSLHPRHEAKCLSALKLVPHSQTRLQSPSITGYPHSTLVQTIHTTIDRWLKVFEYPVPEGLSFLCCLAWFSRGRGRQSNCGDLFSPMSRHHVSSTPPQLILHSTSHPSLLARECLWHAIGPAGHLFKEAVFFARVRSRPECISR